MKQIVHIIGAGFSGLTAAYYLHQAGYCPEIFEQSGHPGGLIATAQSQHGPIETAANALINTPLVETLLQSLKLPWQGTLPASRRRYIYRNRPRQWPLTTRETAILIGRLTRGVLSGRLKPQALQTTAAWAETHLGVAAANWLLAPALQGVYAGDFTQLSASLILGKRWQQRPAAKGKVSQRGSVTPVAGMGALIHALSDYCRDHGIPVYLNTPYPPLGDSTIPRIICTPLKEAGALLAKLEPETSARLQGLQMRGVTTVTAFFEPDNRLPRGFGCLVPASLGFQTRGILFNSDLFDNRSPQRSETWIMDGVENREPAVIETILREERSRLFIQQTPLAVHCQRWPQAFPHYDTALERFLGSDFSGVLARSRIILHGNYLGRIGLADILQGSSELPQRLAKLLVTA